MTGLGVTGDAAKDSRGDPTIVKVLIGLELFLSVAAVGGAIGMISGVSDLHDYNSRLPFASPVFGGAALLVVIGIPPALVAVGAIGHRSWAEPGHLVIGAGLMGWIVVQVVIIGPIAALQPVLFVLGAVIFALGWRNLRRVRRA